jgi:preprotein translocase subunit SecD
VAISNGYDKAFITIVDANVTTLLTALILYLVGTGPVKGFAVTLTIGLAANLFTAVFVSKSLFDLGLARNPRLAKLSI